MNWVFKTTDQALIRDLEQGNKVVYRFTQRRNFKGQEGDQAVFLIQDKQWRFGYYGNIIKVSPKPKEGPVLEPIDFSVTVSDIATIQSPNLLIDFSYTL